MLKGVIVLKSSAKVLVVLLLLMAALTAAPSYSFADNGDVPVSLVYEDGGSSVSAGTGFIRTGDLWVPMSAAEKMGVPISAGPNGKGFIISVREPAKVFAIPSLAELAGGYIPLYFSSAVSDGVSYFNITGMESVTGLTYTSDGSTAVIKKSAAQMQRVPSPQISPEKKRALAWVRVSRSNPDIAAEPRIPGLNVLSPTWFNLMDGSGMSANRASVSFVEEAHKKGYQVWALASNGFSKSITTQMFSSPKAMNLFIARLLIYAKLYNLDGINIDFENVSEADAESYVRFMSMLGARLKEQGIKSSVDVHVPGNSATSRSHSRAALSRYVDYVMLMAYDEHWRTCQTAGSVASLPWVERAVQNTIAEGVDRAKLVLGVPFYSRRWEETPVGGGKVKVKSYTLTMADAEALSALRQAPPMWNEKTGQNFFMYSLNGKTYKIWMEDAASMEKRLILVERYGLAGAAAWARGHEKLEIWNTIERILNRQ